MKVIQPAADVGDGISEFSPDGDAGRTPSISAEIIDRLHLHAEILGELTRGEHPFQANLGELITVHTHKVAQANPDEPNPFEHLLNEYPRTPGAPE